jgi:recombinational DNA repair protein RecT
MAPWRKHVDQKHALAIKTTIRGEKMEVGIESQEIAEALNGDNSPWNCFLFRYGFSEKQFRRFPSATI